MAEKPLTAVVLAAGAGTRMRSARPKPLHLLCGQPMVVHVLDALDGLDVDKSVVVVGHGAEQMRSSLDHYRAGRPALDYAVQSEQRGTGHAVSIAMKTLSDVPAGGDTIVLPGDMPLLEAHTVHELVQTHRERGAAGTVLSVDVSDATGYGRLVRNDKGQVTRIVEHRDANSAELKIREINTSVYCFRTEHLIDALGRIGDHNSQGEIYLTDVIEMLASDGHTVGTMKVANVDAAVGVNDRAQLASAETVLRKRINERWMRAGVTMRDPASTYIDSAVTLEEDVYLYPGTWIRGATHIGRGSQVGPDTSLIDCHVGEDTKIVRSDLQSATVGMGATVGPYSVVQAGAEVVAGDVVPSFTTASASAH